MPLTVTTSTCSFSKKNGPIMPLNQNPLQTVSRLGYVGFSVYACGFSVPQIRQFCCLPRSKWGPLPSVVQAYTPPYSFGGRIKLIICQIRHELSVIIHEISTSWKKTLDGGLYILWAVKTNRNFSLVHNIYIICHFNPLVRIIDLVSHT